ncbi:MAG: Coenzyme F420 hydrogenase/dehydrogenase, beta subunit C-terminal domain [Muribaculaceae bacterium]|nr:Coenzyme F420 hydrogenase/dehydrogenase, beta subunit C-terminal domain [Muribaculaceae bacterium]
MPTLASHKTCTACMGCMNVCPKGAIGKIQYPDGHFGIRVDMNLCIECGGCERVCPIVNGSNYGEMSRPRLTYAAWAENPEVRHRGATSGIFGALAHKMIKAKGGCVAGVVMSGLTCRYILTDDIYIVGQMQGSKYTSSQPDYIYKEILGELRKGRDVLFCGLPCHVAALLSYIPKPLQERLIAIDIICGGVSSPLLIKRFAEEKNDVKSIRSFRNKDEGWRSQGFRYNLKYLSKDDEIISEKRGVRNLVTDGFACELTDRFSCYDCRMAFPSRKSDLTIGDLWGDQDFPEQHFEGISSIIAHSEKGKNFIKEAGIILNPIDPVKVLKPNSRIFNGKSIKQYFPERRMLARGLQDWDYPTLMKVYASDLRARNLLWMPFAAYRLASFKLAELVRKLQNKKLLSKILASKEIIR